MRWVRRERGTEVQALAVVPGTEFELQLPPTTGSYRIWARKQLVWEKSWLGDQEGGIPPYFVLTAHLRVNSSGVELLAGEFEERGASHRVQRGSVGLGQVRGSCQHRLTDIPKAPGAVQVRGVLHAKRVAADRPAHLEQVWIVVSERNEPG